jgi:hypothetical protein
MNKEDADQESFCSDSDDAGTCDSSTVTADSSIAPSQHHNTVAADSSIAPSQHHNTVAADSGIVPSQHHSTVAADSSIAPSQHHPCYSVYSTRGLLCAQRLEMADINTRNSILTGADNTGLRLSGVTVQQVHTFVAEQAGLI